MEVYETGGYPGKEAFQENVPVTKTNGCDYYHVYPADEWECPHCSPRCPHCGRPMVRIYRPWVNPVTWTTWTCNDSDQGKWQTLNEIYD